MNPFERIKEIRQAMMTEAKNAGINANNNGTVMTAREHYQHIFNLLALLEMDLKDAEYNYEVETIDHQIKTFDEYAVLQKELTDDVLIFQPIGSAEDITAADMQSLADILTKLYDSEVIKENMILLPPNINVFRARLAHETRNEIEEV